MLKIIPENERKWISRKEIHYEYDGNVVIFDNSRWPEDLGMAIAMVSFESGDEVAYLLNEYGENLTFPCMIQGCAKSKHGKNEMDLF